MLTTSLKLRIFLAIMTVGLAATGCAAESGPETPVTLVEVSVGTVHPEIVKPVVVATEDVRPDDSKEEAADDWKLHAIVQQEK